MAILLSYSPRLDSELLRSELDSLSTTKPNYKDLNEIDLRIKNFGRIDAGIPDKLMGVVTDTDTKAREKYGENDEMRTDLTRWRIPTKFCIENLRVIPNSGSPESRIQVVVPSVVDFHLKHYVKLLLAKNYDPEKATWIKELFASFKGTKLSDFYQYLAAHENERINQGVEYEDFDLIAFGEFSFLEKKIIETEKMWLTRQFENAKVISDKVFCQYNLPPLTEDLERQGQNQDDIHSELRDSAEKNPCEGMRDEIPPIKITTLLSYPEFKVVMKRKVIKIGYSKVVYHWPELFTRTTNNDLFYSVWSRDELGALLKKVVKKCLRDSAGVSIIIALAARNLPMALKLYRPLVYACIQMRLNEKIDCLFPELILKLNRGDWSPV